MITLVVLATITVPPQAPPLEHRVVALELKAQQHGKRLDVLEAKAGIHSPAPAAVATPQPSPVIQQTTTPVVQPQTFFYEPPPQFYAPPPMTFRGGPRFFGGACIGRS